VVNTERSNMATTTGSDISVVLSGGGDNLNPDHSLGGAASVTPITSDTLNNLFNDVSSEENTSGIDDYRCIYFFNDGDTTVYDVKTFILSDFDAGATMQIGISNYNETQRILITGLPSGGSVTLSYDGNEFVLNYDSDISVMALALQNSLNAMVDVNSDPILQDCVITAQPIQTNILFDVLFAGRDGSRLHPTIQVITNSFTPSVTVTVSKLQSGSPINTTAPQIDSSTTPPGGVGFYASDLNSPITLPKLRTGDGFPLWIERVIPANTTAKSNDGFSVRFQAESLPSGS